MELVGNEVWSGSNNGTMIVHDAKVKTKLKFLIIFYQTGEFIMRIQAPGRGLEEDYIGCLMYVNGNVWCGSSDGSINVFDATTGKCITRLLGHTGSINCFARSEHFVWSGSGDKSIRAWDPDVSFCSHKLEILF